MALTPHHPASQCAAAGLTSVHTHEFGEGWSAAEAWGCYSSFEADGTLPLRIYLTPSADEDGKPPPSDALDASDASAGPLPAEEHGEGGPCARADNDERLCLKRARPAAAAGGSTVTVPLAPSTPQVPQPLELKAPTATVAAAATSRPRRIPLLTCHRAKIFGDGSLGAETAALRMPYVRASSAASREVLAGAAGGVDASAGAAGQGEQQEGRAEVPAEAEANYGQMIYSDAELHARVGRAAREGYRLEVHAIGDAAAAAVLSAFESQLVSSGAEGPAPPLSSVSPNERPILTHCQVRTHPVAMGRGTMGWDGLDWDWVGWDRKEMFSSLSP